MHASIKIFALLSVPALLACPDPPVSGADATDDRVLFDAGRDAARIDAPAGADSGEHDAGAPGDAASTTDAASPGCSPVTPFADGIQPSREIHVATTGSDSNGDGSAAQPYASIEHAASQATPGTAIRIHAGTYSGGAYIADLHGSEAAPIWLGGAAGEARPVIEGGNQALHLVRPRYLVIHDIEARGGAQNGINCDDGGDVDDPLAAHHVVFRNVDIHDVGGNGNQDCLKLSGLNDYWIIDSRFASCGGGSSGSGIDHVGCHRGLIVGNLFENNSGNAIQCKGGSEDIEIRGNLLREPGARGVNMGGSTGFEYFRPPLDASGANAEARDIRVIANVIIGGTAALAFVGCVDCLAANNTIVDPARWVLRILQETTSTSAYTFLPATEGRFINNLVYFDRGALSTFVNVGPDTDAPSFVFTSNLWYAHDDPSQSQPSLPASESDAVVGQDPGLSDPSSELFDISASGAAAGAGSPLTELSADRAGRCFADPPSIGAYEAP